MTKTNRVIIIVLDSVGIGELPDAAAYGDSGSNTLLHIYQKTEGFSLPHLEKLGLGNIRECGLPSKAENPTGAYGKMTETSAGKDTTTGHWELAGLRLSNPFRTFPEGFDAEILAQFKQLTGYDVLCNRPASGTEVIKEYGAEHMKTGCPIVYTSADSVFQIAAHEDIIPLEKLYDICRKTRGMLDKYNVGRVIARPFVGTSAENFTRTANRRDFSMLPYEPTLLDLTVKSGLSVYAVGKIEDIFAGKGITEAVHTVSNNDGIEKTLEFIRTKTDSGIIFTNLVDFDMLYGHRNDVSGYAQALREFDSRLPEILNALRKDDLLMITADHGCDPTTDSTDHSREYVPIICRHADIKPFDLGIRESYSDLAATAAEYLDIEAPEYGKSFLKDILP